LIFFELNTSTVTSSVLDEWQSHSFMFAACLKSLSSIPVEVNFVSENRSRKKSKDMTVEEAGKLGGQKVKRLVEEGKEHELE